MYCFCTFNIEEITLTLSDCRINGLISLLDWRVHCASWFKSGEYWTAWSYLDPNREVEVRLWKPIFIWLMLGNQQAKGEKKKTLDCRINTYNVSAVTSPLSYCVLTGDCTPPDHCGQHLLSLAVSVNRMLVVHHARSKEVSCGAGFCQTRSCTYKSSVNQFLLNRPFLANL